MDCKCNSHNRDGGMFMAIKNVAMDRRDSPNYRNLLKRGGFISASYLPEIISDLQKLLDTIDSDSSYDL